MKGRIVPSWQRGVGPRRGRRHCSWQAVRAQPDGHRNWAGHLELRDIHPTEAPFPPNAFLLPKEASPQDELSGHPPSALPMHRLQRRTRVCYKPCIIDRLSLSARRGSGRRVEATGGNVSHQGPESLLLRQGHPRLWDA